MSDETNTPAPTAAPAKAGWMPTKSTIVGSGGGLVVAQLIIALCDQFGVTLLPTLRDAIMGICMILGNYFHPEGGRK